MMWCGGRGMLQTMLDLTQGFFELLIETTDFGRLDQARGKFRSWMLGALNHFLAMMPASHGH